MTMTSDLVPCLPPHSILGCCLSEITQWLLRSQLVVHLDNGKLSVQTDMLRSRTQRIGRSFGT